MNPFLKLFDFITRLRFRDPEKGNIVVFDYEGSDIIKKFILYNIKFTILPVRGEIFYISARIIALFTKNLLWVYLFYKKYKGLYLVYLLSCIQYIKPKIAITFIDNNSLFHALSEIYNEATFYAIQNGIRNQYAIAKPICNKAYGDVDSNVNFFCFGQHEIDLYKKNTFMIAKFHPVGSLIGGYYRDQQKKPVDYKFDLCLVSQWRSQTMLDKTSHNKKKPFVTLDAYLQKFINERRLSLCIARATQEPEEIHYFKKTYGNLAHIVDFNRFNFSTYIAMDSSKVILTFCSTAGYEVFGWGKKVLFCNFSGDKNYNFPMNGICSVNDDDYEKFKNKLNWLIDIEDEEYLRSTRDASRYLMRYDFVMPAHKYIRKIVMEHLKVGF